MKNNEIMTTHEVKKNLNIKPKFKILTKNIKTVSDTKITMKQIQKK